MSAGDNQNPRVHSGSINGENQPLAKPTHVKRPRRKVGPHPRPWHKVFLQALVENPNILYACRKAKIANVTAYQQRAINKTFAAQWDLALKQGVQSLEAACWDSAKNGDPDWNWYKDSKSRLVKKPLPTKRNTTLAIFMLKAHAPEKYRETFRQEVAGVPGQPLEQVINIVGIKEEDLPQ